MSTGADAKSMPGTPEFRENHARIFGEKKVRRGTFVSRCAHCDGVTHEAGTLLLDCPRCKQKDCYGSIDINLAPPLQTEAAKNAPIMVDRFMEGAQATDGTDIGSRRKREEYKRREGATDKSDYGPGWAERKRVERERLASEATKRSVAEIVKLDRRHLPRFLEEKK